MPETANTTKKTPTRRKAEVTANGYLVLIGRGRPSSKKKYKTVAGDTLAKLIAGTPVKA